MCSFKNTDCIKNTGHRNPDKSNIFFKQNIFNEKLNIISIQKIKYYRYTKNPFMALEDPCRTHLFGISPIRLNDDLFSRSEAFTHPVM